MKMNLEGGNKADLSNPPRRTPPMGGLGTPDPGLSTEPLDAEPVDTPYGNEPIVTEEKGTILEAEEAVPSPTPTSARWQGEAAGSLFDPQEAQDLQSRWNEIQVAFVDEPRAAVEHANNLVIETTKRLIDSFGSGRQRLENEWNKGGDVSTETLRRTLQQYRAFFNRLLAI